jgi:hypothetical protein
MEFYDFAQKYQKQLLREQAKNPPLQNKDNQYKIFKKKRVYGYKQAK